jgi:aminoglycoside/choline kinase family phosphotransferase
MTPETLAGLIHTEAARVMPMTGGASGKLFYRILEKRSSVAIVFETRDSLEEFLAIHTCLSSAGIPVPDVHRVIPDHRLVMIEDLGDLTLTQRLHDRPDEFEIYARLIDMIARIQAITQPSPAHRRAFDAAKYEFEYRFHLLDQLIGSHYRYSLSPEECAELDAFHTQLTAPLLHPSLVLAHRDFQSSNILFRGNEPVLIDFQDARLGNPWYDVVALLEDVYVTVPEKWKEQLIPRFVSQTGIQFSQELYDHTLIQRKLHDAGAFAYCYQKLGNPFYLRYIEPAFSYAVKTMRRFPQWTPACRLFDRIMHHGRTG